MKTTTKFIIELEENEAQALKIILGKLSDNDKTGYGLSQKESREMSELYDALPDMSSY